MTDSRPYSVAGWTITGPADGTLTLRRDDGLTLVLSSDQTVHSSDAIEDQIRLLGPANVDPELLARDIHVRTRTMLLDGWRYMSWACLCGWTSTGRDACVLTENQITARCSNCELVLSQAHG